MNVIYVAILFGVALWIVAMLFIGGLLYAEGQRTEYDRTRMEAER